jgi:fatty acid desaturase
MKALFRYSVWDSLLLAITFFQLGLNIWLAITWDSRPLVQNLVFYPLGLFLFWYNGLVATHNFVHTPWFSSKALNNLYAAFNSSNLLSPITHYRDIHFNHHQYGDDRQDQQGQTQDHSSTFAYGKNGQREHVISYCGLAILRDDLIASFRQPRTKPEAAQLYVESGMCLLALLSYLLISWQFLLFFVVPMFYLGWFLVYLANYYEHFGATPEDRYANSTSHYGRLYNLLCCNEGYHQEHHLRPNVHWRQRPNIYQSLRPALDRAKRVILQYPPPFGFLHHWKRHWKTRVLS